MKHTNHQRRHHHLQSQKTICNALQISENLSSATVPRFPNRLHRGDGSESHGHGVINFSVVCDAPAALALSISDFPQQPPARRRLRQMLNQSCVVSVQRARLASIPFALAASNHEFGQQLVLLFSCDPWGQGTRGHAWVGDSQPHSHPMSHQLAELQEPRLLRSRYRHHHSPSCRD